MPVEFTKFENRIVKKLHINIAGHWLPVFCNNGGRVITCADAPQKALPTRVMWAADDLAHFRSKFSNQQFELRVIAKG